MLSDQYQSSIIESKWQVLWEQLKLYKWSPDKSREDSFIIDTPPPTVSGLLHMGHIFSYTQTDFIARFWRMWGKNVFYPIGFDDNGLPTERLVEKIKGIRATQMHREDFKALCKEIVKDAETEFRNLFKSIALSVDWSQEYQTINPDVTKISQASFIDLYNKGHIERVDSPTFWDPVDKTAIAQAEIEDKERQGFMNKIVFECDDGRSKLVIATTRPELLSACVALLYHPADERYHNLSKHKAIVPVYNHTVPIFADDAVEKEKGTGLVMCCTFGDIQDIYWWRKHKLELKSCIALGGQMQNAGILDGLYVKDARNKIIEILKAKGLLLEQTEVTQFVKCAERSGAPLEIIATPQWYIKVLDKKEQIIQKARQCKWHPDYMRIRLENWVNGLNQDWCISRQRYFGVPFPVWYSKKAGEEGKILIADIDQLPIDPGLGLPKGYNKDEVIADLDVMDTWATSALTPQISSRGLNEDFTIEADRHQKLYPADLRPQAHEIIRTWAFYTIVKSLLHADSIPWKNLMISGWCLASDKTKMSKSKGNVVTPKELIEERGADIVRYWASNSKLGVDIIYSEEVFKLGRKLLTKLWNATKFVSIHLQNTNYIYSTVKDDIANKKICEDHDIWILSKLYKTTESATKSFKDFEYCDARVSIEEFFWNDLCDNYLELVKSRLYNAEPENALARQSGIYTVYHLLKNLYRLFAPFIPHICDELNQSIFGGESVNLLGSWPRLENFSYSNDKEKEGDNTIIVLELIRKYKTSNKLSLNAPLDNVGYTGVKLSLSMESDLKKTVNTKEIIYSPALSGETTFSEDGKIGVSCDFSTQSAEKNSNQSNR